MRAEHGRYLSGLGSESPSGETGYDPRYQNMATYELEMQDDTFGSGIFDPGGRKGTANSNMGVFASHYSLPGYAAREVPFTVSRDVTDITDGAEVVVVPGGGLSYVETRGKLTRPAVLGPTWRPPQIQPAGVTRRDQPYAFLTRPGQAPAPPLNPGAPVIAAPTYRPKRDSKYWADEIAATPGSCALPNKPSATSIPPMSMVDPFDPGIAVKYPAPCAGFGQDEPKKPLTAAQLVFAGLVAGAATGLVVTVVRRRK